MLCPVHKVRETNQGRQAYQSRQTDQGIESYQDIKSTEGPHAPRPWSEVVGSTVTRSWSRNPGRQRKEAQMATVRAHCPGCRQRIELEPLVERGDEVTCSHCGTDWQIVSVAPLILDWLDEGPVVRRSRWRETAPAARAKEWV